MAFEGFEYDSVEQYRQDEQRMVEIVNDNNALTDVDYSVAKRVITAAYDNMWLPGGTGQMQCWMGIMKAVMDGDQEFIVTREMAHVGAEMVLVKTIDMLRRKLDNAVDFAAKQFEVPGYL